MSLVYLLATKQNEFIILPLNISPIFSPTRRFNNIAERMEKLLSDYDFIIITTVVIPQNF